MRQEWLVFCFTGRDTEEIDSIIRKETGKMVDRLTGEGISRTDVGIRETTEGLTKDGIWEGASVQVVEDALSLIADAAEELTFEASETVEKKAEERRIEKEKPSPLIAGIKDCCELVPDLDKDRLQAWIKAMLKNPPKSMKELQESLKGLSKEVSHQYLALSLLAEFSSEDPALKELAEEAKKQLEDTDGESIRAAINTSAVVQEYANAGLDTTENLRDFYRETVLHYEGASETFKAVLDRFPGESLLKAAEYLIRAAGNDLHRQGSSIDKEELRMILNDLYYLETLGHLYRSFEVLTKRIQEGFNVVPLLGTKELLGEFLSLKDAKWLGESNILELLRHMGIEESSARIYFLQGFIDVVRAAPLKIFSGDDERNTLISKIQESLDRCIEEEI